MSGFIRGVRANLSFEIHTDAADFVGDKNVRKSISAFLALPAKTSSPPPLGSFPKKQTTVAYSTPEAEIVLRNVRRLTSGEPFSRWHGGRIRNSSELGIRH
jgi:hypothetical protein